MTDDMPGPFVAAFAGKSGRFALAVDHPHLALRPVIVGRRQLLDRLFGLSAAGHQSKTIWAVGQVGVGLGSYGTRASPSPGHDSCNSHEL